MCHDPVIARYVSGTRPANVPLLGALPLHFVAGNHCRDELDHFVGTVLACDEGSAVSSEPSPASSRASTAPT